MRIVVCRECGNKNKISGRLKGRSCKECSARLDLQDRTPTSGGASSVVVKKISGKRVLFGLLFIALAALLLYFTFTVPFLMENFLVELLIAGIIIFLIGFIILAFSKKKVAMNAKSKADKKSSFIMTLIGGILMIAAMVIMLWLFTMGIGFLENIQLP